MQGKTAWGCLGIIGVALVAGSVLVVLNRDVVSEALDTQSKRVGATLFRMGELLSMSAELQDRYGTKPEMSYGTGDGGRTLSIVFAGYRVPEDVAPRDHAREIAVFAHGTTTKHEEIDVVEVSFRTTAGGGSGNASVSPGPFAFERHELIGAVGE